jgi:transglutaminase-like putative cysteine protease
MMTSGMWLGLMLVVYVPVCFYVAMVLALKVALDRQAGAVLPVEERPVDPQRVAWHVSARFPRKLLWRLALGLAGVSALLALGIFLLMPRVPRGLLIGAQAGSGDWASSGLSESMQLNDVRRIRPDSTVVMRVKITDAAGRDVGRSGYQGYFRAHTYYGYIPAERAWRLAMPNHSWSVESGDVSLLAHDPNALTQQVLLDPSVLPALPRLEPMIQLHLPNNVNALSLYPDVVVDQPNMDAPLQYTAVSLAAPLTPNQRRQLAMQEWRRPVEWPDAPHTVSPAVAQLARQWCQDLPPPPPANQAARDAYDLAVAGRICQNLQRDYGYTLDLSGYEPVTDPVEEFLFRVRRGHCELFASAMTLMCRALGVQCRLAGGFLVSEYSSMADGYLVRNSDAHAWCEVYTPGQDWQVFDPTPAGASDRPTGALAGVKNWLGALKFLWSTRVVNYSESDRQRLFGGLLRRFEATWRGVLQYIKKALASLKNLAASGRMDENIVKGLGVTASALALAAMSVLSWKLLRRRRRYGLRPSRQMPRWYLRLHRLTVRRGVRQEPGQTPREFLRQCADRLSLPPDKMERLAELLYLVRWGGAAPQAIADEGAQLAENIRQSLNPKS